MTTTARQSTIDVLGQSEYQLLELRDERTKNELPGYVQLYSSAMWNTAAVIVDATIDLTNVGAI